MCLIGIGVGDYSRMPAKLSETEDATSSCPDYFQHRRRSGQNAAMDARLPPLVRTITPNRGEVTRGPAVPLLLAILPAKP